MTRAFLERMLNKNDKAKLFDQPKNFFILSFYHESASSWLYKSRNYHIPPFTILVAHASSVNDSSKLPLEKGKVI